MLLCASTYTAWLLWLLHPVHELHGLHSIWSYIGAANLVRNLVRSRPKIISMTYHCLRTSTSLHCTAFFLTEADRLSGRRRRHWHTFFNVLQSDRRSKPNSAQRIITHPNNAHSEGWWAGRTADLGCLHRNRRSHFRINITKIVPNRQLWYTKYTT